MGREVEYSRCERLRLFTLAVFGIAGVNGAFLCGLLFQPRALAEVMTNPIAAAFMLEARARRAALAYLLSKWRVSWLSWAWFVILSLLGSMAFALPVVLLWPRGGRGQASEPPAV